MSKTSKRKSKSGKKGFMPQHKHETVSTPKDNPQKPIVPEQINQQLELGVKYCQGGQFPEVEACFQQVLKWQPDNVDAWHLLGVMAAQQKRYATAIEHIQRAIELKPTEATFHNHLGNVYLEQKQFYTACESYQKARKLQPNHADARKNLAIACEKLLDLAIEHHQAQRLAEAETVYQQVLEYQPNCADAWHLWGVIAYERKECSTAIERIERAIEINPKVTNFYKSLGYVYEIQKQFARAIKCYQESIKLQADDADTLCRLGRLLKDRGSIEKAIECYQKALQLNPDDVGTYNKLGIAYKKQGHLTQAIQCYQKILQLQPNNATAYNNLGQAYKQQGRQAEAIKAYQKAIELQPDYAIAQGNLVTILQYSSDYEPSAIYEAHRKWAQSYAQPLATTIDSHRNDPNPERRLRIGYVSGDFKHHSVAFFFEPLLRSHNHDDFEIICYVNNEKTDATTQQLQYLADGWREIDSLNDEQVAELIRQDQIDILVDLSGYTQYNRLLVFARKPAPVQVTYLGYPNTTGLDTIDYRLSDAWADPAGKTEHLHSEELIRLPHGFVCYQPPSDSPEVSPLPVLTSKQITFGSFNNLEKVTPELIGYWAKILKEVPNSCLMIKSRPLVDVGTRDYVLGQFKQHGIPAERLELIGWIPDKREHLALYNQVDIALDTFPYNGTTTTCEALWMGVPVITFAGQTHVSRVGVSLLSSVGLEELIAESAEDYIQKAINLANNWEQLQELRATLRDRMEKASLTNAKLITQSLEDAYRAMWRHWCDKVEAQSFSVKGINPEPQPIQPIQTEKVDIIEAGALQKTNTDAEPTQTSRKRSRKSKKRRKKASANQSKGFSQMSKKVSPIQITSESAKALYNQGLALKKQGKLTEAIACYQKAIQLQPDYAQAHNSLGIAYRAQGQSTEAIQCYRKAIEVQPNYVQAYNNLGNVLRDEGQLEEAIAAYRQALKLNPNYVSAYFNLGNALQEQGEVAEAIECFEKAIQRQPNYSDAYSSLGHAYKTQENLPQAVACYKKAIQLQPDSAELHYYLGIALRDQGQKADAARAYERAIQLDPNHLLAITHLGELLRLQGYPSLAIEQYQKALTIDPDNLTLQDKLGSALFYGGSVQEAIELYQKLIDENPTSASYQHQNLLFYLNYSDEHDPSTIYAEHRRWAERYETLFKEAIQPHKNKSNRERRLRIGYVSSDLRTHSVAFFFEPLLTAHNHHDFEIICYANSKQTDATTQRLRQLADGWREIYQLNDKEVDDLIRQDQIDILVDLAGHTSGTSLLLFARKPAPIQVTYLGYPNTTGLDTVDYRITDAWADPEGQTEQFHSEQLIRLPHGFLCYQPGTNFPEVSPLPMLKQGQVTFGCFNNLPKISPSLIRNWAAILKAVPNSHMLIKSWTLADAGTRDRLQELFQQQGIDSDRLELIGWIADKSQHLALYNQVDIALDTFPYNGTTTTCEAMWMGVPVITQAGKTHASRVGVSLLSSVGLEELIAESAEEYIQKAIDLANNWERLQELRATLRDQMKKAPLTNAKLITQSLEDAYRSMWRRWCANEGAQSVSVKEIDPEPQPIQTEIVEGAKAEVNEQSNDQIKQQLELGLKHQQSGRVKEAEACYQQVLLQQPENADAWHLLGVLAGQQKQYQSAIERINRAIELNPKAPHFYNNLGNVYREQGQFTEAIECYQRAIQLQSDYADAYYNLGIAYRGQGQFTEAIECYQKAIQLQPIYAKAFNNLGTIFQEQGKFEEAVQCYRQALQLKPDQRKFHSNLLFALSASLSADSEQILLEAQCWYERQIVSQGITLLPHANDRTPERKLRIGYVSPDFRRHSVSYFIEQIVQTHNRSQVEVYCYAEVAQPDEVTQRLQTVADHWRFTVDKSDVEVAQRIQQDQIDILIDLAGHTRNHRLKVFAMKPAPVQATYLGYFATTGLPTIDYWITDSILHPQGTTEKTVEQIWRLPRCYVAYQPPQQAPEVSPPPVLKTGKITFGCFNTLSKVTNTTVELWAQVLKTVPNSYLLLKTTNLKHEQERQRIQQMFAEQGIAPERLLLHGYIPSLQEHLRMYAEVDICLDTFPYTGCTTTCEALWMGLPVLTLAGSRKVGRMSASLLNAIGREDWIAQSVDEFVEKAVELASDPERLQEFRMNQRQQIEQSPLRDSQGLTRALEDAYRQMWRHCCSKGELSKEALVQISWTNPDQIDTQLNLGMKYCQSQQFSEAEICLEQVLKMQPDNPDALYLMGLISAQQKQYSIARERLEKAIKLKPNEAVFYLNFGHVYLNQEEFQQAIEYYQKAIRLQPNYAEAHENLGIAYGKQGNLTESYRSLGIAHQIKGYLTQALQYYHRLLQLQPNNAVVCNTIGNVYKEQGRQKEAINYYQKAIQLQPNYANAESNLTNILLYSNDYEPSAIYNAHRKWAESYAQPLAATIDSYSNDLNPERRLSIGYVSGNFKTHSVAFFLEPLLAAHNHLDFEIICYANNKETDATTQRLRQLADSWHEIYTLNDEQVAELIRQDGIDILVDLSGHTKDNRQLVFARKPAPVQVTYLGYPDTTGLDTINYRFTDAWADPEGKTEHLHTEELIRLPHGFLCYQPIPDSPEVSPPPVLTSKQITFGSFNNLSKVTPELIGYWAEILTAIPNSRLLIKSKPLVDAGTRDYIHEQFKQHGIEPERIELIGWLPDTSQHLALYNQVDIALDTFPYNGTTTTCEAMWMGVPVITLAGQTHVSRVGVSLLSSVGLEELIAESAEEYIQKAIALANNLERLQELRASLRERMKKAPLTNAKLITQSLEEAYRTMWQKFCDQSPLEPDQRLLEIEGGVKICVKDDLNSLTTYVLLEQGDWFEPEMAFIRRLITPGMQILDIGANHGVYTLTMAKLLRGQGQVTAYEPDRSVVKRLRKSVNVNELTTVEIVNAGLSDHEGEATLFVSANSELNSLHQISANQKQETIQLLSLDRELERRGWQDISFIKLDAEGEEPKILEGGQRFFSEQSPLIMFELKHGKQINLPLIKLFQQFGYDTYRFVPGLGLLVPFDVTQPVDSYQLNLFACKGDRAQQLIERDLLIKEVSEKPALPTPAYWLDAISDLDYAKPFLSQWRSLATNADHNTQTYLEGLSYFLLAKSDQVTSEEQLASLQYAFECIQQSVRENPSLTRRCSLARVAAELGQRKVSVQALQELCNTLRAGQPIAINEPFLPVNPQYDYQQFNDKWQDWLFVSILETYENSRAFSSYFSPQQSVTLLSQIIQKTFHSNQAESRLQLAKKRFEGKQDANLPSATTVATKNRDRGSTSELFPISDIFDPPLLSIVDIGAMELAGHEDRFVRLAKRGMAKILGFEPLPEECAKLNEKSDGWRRYLPYAIADGSQKTLYVTNTGMTSSLLPPNQELTSLFMNLSELMEVIRTEEIVTRRLDDIPEIVEGGCDLLKVDVQGLEFEIFCNATTVLSNCLVVQTEVEFVPLYQNQPLFAEVDQVLRKNGFVFHKFLGLSGRPFKPLMKNDNPNALISQVLWSDAVYVRDFTQLNCLAPEKLLKLAALLHESYGSFDLCHHILNVYERQTGEMLASRYLERLVQKPKIQTEKNQTSPAQIAKQLDLGIKHYQSGKLSKAEACFQQVLRWQPNHVDAWHLLGIIAAQQKQYSTAIKRINCAIELKPTEANFHSNLGNVYLEQEQFQSACESYQKALQLAFNNADTQKKLAIASEKLLDLAIENHQAGRLSEAEICYQQVLKYQPNRDDAWHLWGVIAYEEKDYPTAIERINRAIEINPNVANFYNSLGSVYQKQRNLTEATECYQKAIQLQPDFKSAYNNLGMVLKEDRKLEEAVQCYQKILQLQPDAVDTYVNLGIALQELGKVEEAIESYQTALQLQPDHQIALKQYVWARRRICKWDGLTSFEQSLISAAQSEQWATPPFPLLSVTDDPALHLAATKNYCTKSIGNSFSPLWDGQRYSHNKIRLAYLSANFHQHAVAYLMAELFECHDRSRFDLFAISFGREDTSPMRQRLVKAFDRFIDVRQMSHLEAAQQIRNLEIDIAVDLQGYTKDCRPQILAHRPAPIQVNYLGYPGTLGADFIDYILVDPFIVSPDQQPYFTEKLIHLPDCYLVNDSQRIIAEHTPSREECGLPPQGFVFCSFNNSYKITPDVFDIWMRLLQGVSGSVLWLSGKNKSMQENLRREAHARGVNSERLIFAPREQKLSDHLARQRLADLFLDTLPYNAHTTSSDALWAGLPVLTCAGRSFAARVAGSLLHAIGLPELVTYNLADYETMALKLATQPDVLRQIKEKLERNRLSTPLFDCDRFRRHIEEAYTEMWSIWQRGEKPRAFAVLQKN